MILKGNIMMTSLSEPPRNIFVDLTGQLEGEAIVAKDIHGTPEMWHRDDVAKEHFPILPLFTDWRKLVHYTLEHPDVSVRISTMSKDHAPANDAAVSRNWTRVPSAVRRDADPPRPPSQTVTAQAAVPNPVHNFVSPTSHAPQGAGPSSMLNHPAAGGSSSSGSNSHGATQQRKGARVLQTPPTSYNSPKTDPRPIPYSSTNAQRSPQSGLPHDLAGRAGSQTSTPTHDRPSIEAVPPAQSSDVPQGTANRTGVIGANPAAAYAKNPAPNQTFSKAHGELPSDSLRGAQQPSPQQQQQQRPQEPPMMPRKNWFQRKVWDYSSLGKANVG
ncbi:hypothetical protein BC834DRAFT_971270 [Gloeopeniophorella convolvens]|nr:hypothetical protein BC834DRAFT_971270 [Gloeopeniophorella convolvens]